MKAMKQVVSGAEFPVSYLTNSQGFRVEADADEPDPLLPRGSFCPPIPMIKSGSGEAVIRWHFDAKERVTAWKHRKAKRRKDWSQPLTTLLQMMNFALKREAPKYTDPALASVAAFEVGTHELYLKQLPMKDWFRFFVFGDVWQVLREQDGRFVPVMLRAVLPVSLELLGKPRGVMAVIMAAKGMRTQKKQGEAELAAVMAMTDGKYGVVGKPEFGLFGTENEAIAAYGAELRKATSRQYGGIAHTATERKALPWEDSHDAMSHSGTSADWPPTLLCPKCEVPLSRTVTQAVGAYAAGFLSLNWGCPKCKTEFESVDWPRSSAIRIPAEDFESEALAAGFTKDQVAFLWAKFRAVK